MKLLKNTPFVNVLPTSNGAGIDQFLRDCLAGGGRTGRLDRARLWDCGLAGCIVHLTGVIDCVLGEGEDTVRRVSTQTSNRKPTSQLLG